MSFSKKKSNFSKKAASVILIVAVVVGLGMGGYYFINRYISGIKIDYESKLKNLQLQQYNSKRQAYEAKETITLGTQLKEDLFNVVDLSSSLDRGLYVSKDDMGKFAKYEITAGIPAMKYMISDEKIQNDIRREEFNMFLLQSNLKKDEFIDLRLMYPNGEDFIVLSKKKIRDINLAQNTIWCWLDEREILTVSSAIVDSYINKGTKLYVVTYVEPSSQKDSMPTYPANVNVMRLMASDPNIVDRAKLYLAEQVRVALDSRLKAIPPDISAKVQAELSKEITGIQGTIQKDAINNNSVVTNTQETQQQPQQQPQQDIQQPILPTATIQTIQSQPPSNPKSTPAKDNKNNKKEGVKSGFFN